MRETKVTAFARSIKFMLGEARCGEGFGVLPKRVLHGEHEDSNNHATKTCVTGR